MFKVEIKVKLDFAKIRVYIVHKMDGSIVKYTKYLKCESKHNNVRSLLVSRCGVCSKVLGSNPFVWQNRLNYPGSSAQAITNKATLAQTHFKRNNSGSVG